MSSGNGGRGCGIEGGSRGLGAPEEGRGEGEVGGEPCHLDRTGGGSVHRGTLDDERGGGNP